MSTLIKSRRKVIMVIIKMMMFINLKETNRIGNLKRCVNFFALLVLSFSSFTTLNAQKNQTQKNTMSEFPASFSKEGELLNRIVLEVGDQAITEIDIEQMMKNTQVMNRNRNIPRRQAAIDELIERAIVEMDAKQESIIISEARIQNEVKRRMEYSGSSSEDAFKKLVARESGMPYEIWLADLRYQILKRSLIQIKLTVPQPDKKEIEEFYRKHRNMIGEEVRYREITLQPANSSIDEEARISNLARDLYGRILNAPVLFGEIAINTRDNVSPLKGYGGLQDFVPIHDVARRDQILAGVLYNLYVGQISPVFRDALGRYVIIKMESKRPVPLEHIEDVIRSRIYIEKEEKVFDDWIKKQKSEVAIVRVAD